MTNVTFLVEWPFTECPVSREAFQPRLAGTLAPPVQKAVKDRPACLAATGSNIYMVAWFAKWGAGLNGAASQPATAALQEQCQDATVHPRLMRRCLTTASVRQRTWSFWKMLAR